MKTITFKSNEYILVDSLNVAIDRLQASIARDNVSSVDELLEEVNDIQKVTIKDGDGEIVKTYTKYTKPLAVAIYDDVISVELLNKILLQELEEEEE